MDATITNTSASEVFLPGPNLNIAAGASAVWPDITVETLDGSVSLKTMVQAGTLTVSLADDTRDAAAATQGSLLNGAFPIFAFANLPTGFEGRTAFVSDGRKTAEVAGAGTGVPAYFSNGAWRTFPADAAVTV